MLTQLKGVGDVTKKKLNDLGIYTGADMLFRMPKSYLDLREFANPYTVADGEYAKIKATIKEKTTPFRKGALQMFRLKCDFGGFLFSCTYFNQNYLYKQFSVDTEYVFFGKLKKKGNSFEYINPQYEIASEKSKFDGIQPIYYTKGLIPQRTYHEIALSALKEASCPQSVVPEDEPLISLRKALQYTHAPETLLEAYEGRRRIVMEITVRRLAALRLEKQWNEGTRKKMYTEADEDYSSLTLPFALTPSQKTAVEGLLSVLRSRDRLNAILCGDVGSGKTAVAIIISYIVAKSAQVAFMAPTEILANQHYELIKNLFAASGIPVMLLTSAVTATVRRHTLSVISTGMPCVVVGTHSLLNIDFAKLAFVVIDEQHRYGVAQRTKLLNKGLDVDVLTLSATPIPRSMQLIAYGNLEYFTIEKRFEGNVKTKIVPGNKTEAMLDYIATRCSIGDQAFVVLPMIEDSEGEEIFGAKGFYDKLTKTNFKNLRVGLLHGKQKSNEKAEIVKAFRERSIDVLVSTTVVEVGIDVPNASLMAIMNCERFGLATLHQLRGRVGRDGKEAYCFLCTADEPPARIEKVASCNNGFELAEYDFSVKSGGDVFGVSQSGDGSVYGLTFEIISTSKEIASRVDLSLHQKLLEAEAERFALAEVSFT